FEDFRPQAITQHIDELMASVTQLDDAHKQVMKYSSGMLHRLGVARAMLKRPPVLLLDEPSRSLDPAASEQLWQMLRSLGDSGTTVVIASHNFEETATLANMVAVLDRGRLAGIRSFTPCSDAGAV